MFLGKATLVFVLVMPVLMWVVVVAGGGGHGSYLPAKILFPYTMASTGFTVAIVQPFIAVAFVQYPVYGIFLDWMRSVGRFKQGALALVGAHVVAVMLAFGMSNPSFTP